MFILLKTYLSNEVIRQRKKRVLGGLILLFGLVAALLWFMPAQTPPDSVARANPNPTPVPSDTPLPANTPVPTNTPLPTVTPIPTVTPTYTPTPIPIATNTLEPIAIIQPTPIQNSITGQATTGPFNLTPPAGDGADSAQHEGTAVAVSGTAGQPAAGSGPSGTETSGGESKGNSPPTETGEEDSPTKPEKGTAGNRDQTMAGEAGDQDGAGTANSGSQTETEDTAGGNGTGPGAAPAEQEANTTGSDAGSASMPEPGNDGTQKVPPHNMPTTGGDTPIINRQPVSLPAVPVADSASNEPRPDSANRAAGASTGLHGWGMVWVALGIVLVLVGGGVSAVNGVTNRPPKAPWYKAGP